MAKRPDEMDTIPDSIFNGEEESLPEVANPETNTSLETIQGVGHVSLEIFMRVELNDPDTLVERFFRLCETGFMNTVDSKLPEKAVDLLIKPNIGSGEYVVNTENFNFEIYKNFMENPSLVLDLIYRHLKHGNNLSDENSLKLARYLANVTRENRGSGESREEFDIEEIYDEVKLLFEEIEFNDREFARHSSFIKFEKILKSRFSSYKKVSLFEKSELRGCTLYVINLLHNGSRFELGLLVLSDSNGFGDDVSKFFSGLEGKNSKVYTMMPALFDFKGYLNGLDFDKKTGEVFVMKSARDLEYDPELDESGEIDILSLVKAEESKKEKGFLGRLKDATLGMFSNKK